MVCHGSRTRLLNKTRDSHPYCEDRQDERQMREHATRDKMKGPLHIARAIARCQMEQ
jgi:hypothetical protein